MFDNTIQTVEVHGEGQKNAQWAGHLARYVPKEI